MKHKYKEFSKEFGHFLLDMCKIIFAGVVIERALNGFSGDNNVVVLFGIIGAVLTFLFGFVFIFLSTGEERGGAK